MVKTILSFFLGISNKLKAVFLYVLHKKTIIFRERLQNG